jgi:C-terminal peptidase prc
MGPRILAAAALLLCFACGRASGEQPVSAQHLEDLRNGFRALTGSFYRNVAPANLIAGARLGIGDAFKAAKRPAPPMPPLRGSADPVGQIAVAVAAGRRANVLSETDLTYAALTGMAHAAGDRYTVFLTPKQLKGFEEPLNPPHVFGIGVLLQQDEKTKDVSAAYVAPGTPAEAAGVQNGDVFDSVDGTNAHGLDIAHVRALLLGKTGTTVRVRLMRGGAMRDELSIVRAEVHAPTVYQKLLPNGIGYIAVGVFGEPTAEEFGAALRTLQRLHARAFVIDLRNNGGGYVNAAVGIADHFVHSGPIVSIAERRGTTEFDADANADEMLPVAVLVNHYSASASEITAAALQDTGVATLVGARTYGKGVVQQIVYNGDGSAMKITTARYLTPHNRVIDGIGLSPDVAVVENEHARYGDPAGDAQLAAAINIVQAKARL